MRELKHHELAKVAGGLEMVNVTANVYNIPSYYFPWDSGSNRPLYDTMDAGGGGADATAPTAGTTASSGLGSQMDSLINMSPLMAKQVRDIQSWGYSIVWDSKSYTDYVKHEIHLSNSLPTTQDMMGALAHELGHVLYAHYYGVADYNASRDVYVNDWVRNEGYAQVNTMRIRESMPPLTDVIHLQGSSTMQIQTEYTAYRQMSGRYFSDPIVRERSEYLPYVSQFVGNTMRTETAYVDPVTNEKASYEQMYGHNWDVAHIK